MSEHYYYLLVNFGCIGVPFLFSFHPRLKFYLHWKSFAVGALLMACLFIPWDAFFTSKGIWGFNDKYIIGKKLFHLPLEEWLFFVCIPYACCFTYHCFNFFFSKTTSAIWWRYLAVVFAAICIIAAVLSIGKWYTLMAHALCALLLILHIFIWRSNYLGRFLLMYIVILVPFLASNGVLTGVQFWRYPFFNFEPEAITEKIVWYNNDHNLGFRLFSMPVDDLAYGMLMLLLVITGYEWNEQRIKKQSTIAVQEW